MGDYAPLGSFVLGSSLLGDPTLGAFDAYVNLITSQHNQKPNFVATVALSCQPYADQIAFMQNLYTQFDIDSAIGAQLDILGKWIGLSREVNVPITGVYFSLDVAGLGLDQGYLQGPFDPTQGIVALSDDVYRFALYAKIAANRWNGTILGASQVVAELFTASSSPGTNFFIQDGQDMTMTFALAGANPPPILVALLKQVIAPTKPAGVQAFFTQTSVNGSAIFGLDVENKYISGLDVGALGVPA